MLYSADDKHMMCLKINGVEFMTYFWINLALSLSLIACGTGTTEEKAVQLEDEDSRQSVTDTGDANNSNDSNLPEETGEALPEPEDTGTPLPIYCSGSPSHVICDPAVNLDLWWEYSGETRFSTVAGTVLSFPFTTRASEVDGGQLGFTTSEPPFIDGTSFRVWLSDTPGGIPLASWEVSDCDFYFAQARSGIYWTQNHSHEGNTGFCILDTDPRVLYANFEVCQHDDTLECLDERQGGYVFDVRRSYRRY